MNYVYMYINASVSLIYTLYTHSLFPRVSEKGLGHSGGGLPGHIRHHVQSAVRGVHYLYVYIVYDIYI